MQVPEPSRPPSTSGFLGTFALGWLVSQVVGFAVFSVVAATFLVSGVPLGVAVAGELEGSSPALSAGVPLVALALWQIPAWATQLGAVAVATVARGRSLVHDLGLVIRPVDVATGVGGGVVAQIGVTVLYQVVGVDAEGPARQLTAKGEGPLGAAVLLVLLALVAPVVEELLFRGLLQRGLARHLPAAAVVVLTAVLFAAAHLQGPQFPGLVVVGVVLSVLAQRSGRLGPSIVAHMTFNAVTVIALVATAA